MRIVLDTNVLVSGVFFGGIPSRILDEWAMERFTVYASPSIMDEYLRVIERMRSTQAQEAIADHWTAMLPKVCHMIPDQRLPRAVSRDPSDDKFIACAMAANAGCLVTGDLDLKTVPQELDFKIVSPHEFLNILK